ncbi:MAG TPA: glutathione peroxidase [Rhodocyclaceae bacterium]
MADNVYVFKATTLDGKACSLSEFEGRVALVVNVASRCGFTPQYEALEKLWRQYRDRGLVVLGFPCNQFGAQEPEDEAGIAKFCQQNYGVSFPMFAKVKVNGDEAHDLFRYLTKALPGVMGSTAIKWNFTKFLIGRDGVPRRRFAPATTPEEIIPEIERLL